MKYFILTSILICNTLAAMDSQEAPDTPLSMHPLFPVLYNKMHQTRSIYCFKNYRAEIEIMPSCDLRRLRTAWLLLKKELRNHNPPQDVSFSAEVIQKLDRIIEEEDNEYDVTETIRDGISMRMLQKRTPSPICINALTPQRASPCRAPSPLHQ